MLLSNTTTARGLGGTINFIYLCEGRKKTKLICHANEKQKNETKWKSDSRQLYGSYYYLLLFVFIHHLKYSNISIKLFHRQTSGDGPLNKSVFGSRTSLVSYTAGGVVYGSVCRNADLYLSFYVVLVGVRM